MSPFASSMMTASFGLVLYNLVQKNQPVAVHPFQILSVAYLTAAIVSVAIHRTVPSMGVTSLKSALLPAACLGLTIIVVEVGFMFVYRSGWKIGLASTVSTAAASAVLLPIGVVFLRDHITTVNLMGIALCVAGLFLISR